MRVGRLMTMLRLLESRSRMTAGELATQLEVSQRTVLRDVEALNEAGFHVVARRGAQGGFELLRGGGSAGSLIGTGPQGARRSGTGRGPGDEGRGAGSGGDGRAAGGGRMVVRLSPHGRQLAALIGRPAGLRVRRRQTAGHERDGWMVASAPMQSPQAALHDILALGPNAEVIGPPALRSLVREAAGAIEALHR